MEDELRHSPLLASLKSGARPEEAPEGYFEALLGRVQSRIEEEQEPMETPFLASLMPTLPTAPEAYFEAFPSRILDRIDAGSEQDETPFLASLQPILPAVPENYFDTLPQQVMAQVAQESAPIAKVRQLIPVMWRTLPIRAYAMAAAVAVLVVAGIALWKIQPVSVDAPIYMAQTTQEALKAFTEEELMAVAVEHTTTASQLDAAVDEEALATIAIPKNHVQSLTKEDAEEIMDDLDLEDLDPAMLDEINLEKIEI